MEDHPLFAQAKGRGIRALAGHAESTDLTNDVNGGPSGIGIATAAGKAAFWDIVGAPELAKMIALEGEFAMTEGHAQELKTQALALQVGKRLRVMISDNNAGIDDCLIGGKMGGVIASQVLRRLRSGDQWTSYGWNVFTLSNGNDYGEVAAALKAMDEVGPARPPSHRSPSARRSRVTGPRRRRKNPRLGGDQLVGYPSHPYALKMNSEYFVALAQTFEKHYGVEFEGIRKGPVSDNRERLIQFKTNIDVVMSLLDRNGLGDWLADRLVEIGDTVRDDVKLRISATSDPFLDDRLRVAKLPEEPQKVSIRNAISGAEKQVGIALFRKPGEVAGARRAISEIIKWMNYVTEGPLLHAWPPTFRSRSTWSTAVCGDTTIPGTIRWARALKAAIQEAGNVSTAIGLVSQSASVDPEKFAGVWALSGTYGAFTPLMYTPARVWSQQNQDSKFRIGVLHILAAHSGPETAADARTHFGIFAPQVWKLFPRGQVINLSFWDYNDVAPGYFAAAEIAARDPNVGIITLEVARPDFAVADRSQFRRHRSARCGQRPVRDPRFRARQAAPRLRDRARIELHGESGESAAETRSGRSQREGDRRDQRGLVRSPAGSVSRFRAAARGSLRSDGGITGTRRMWPLRNLGPLTDEYSLTSDFGQSVADAAAWKRK